MVAAIVSAVLLALVGVMFNFSIHKIDEGQYFYFDFNRVTEWLLYWKYKGGNAP